MVQYKLYYFDARGLAEPVRLLLHYAGQPFEDVRFTSMEEWKLNEKSKFFYGKMPVLEIDGEQQLGQSAAILRFLAEKFGLAGKDAWEMARANEIIDFQKDLYAEVAPYLYTKMGFRDGDLDKLRSDPFEPAVKRTFPLFVKLLKESGSGFLLPSGLTMADFQVANYLQTFAKIEPETLGKYPELIQYVERFHALPKLKKYIDGRKFFLNF